MVANGFGDYYEAMSKLEGKVVHEWTLFPEDGKETTGFLPRQAACRNAIDLSLDSFVFAAVGGRGSGKTEFTAGLAIQCKYLWPDIRIVSNFPIKWTFEDRHGKRTPCQSEPLDLYAMVKFDDNYQHCLILLDEAPSVVNRYSTTTTRSRIINLWLQQLRKNWNSLAYCAQDFKFVDGELQFQTDVLIYVKDASRRYPESGLKRGGVVLLNLLDNSGQWTGYPYSERQRVFKQKMLAEYVWGCFDSHYVIDVLSQLWRLELDKETVKVSSGSGGHGVQPQSDFYERAAELLEAAQSSGETIVKQKELYTSLNVTTAQKQAISHCLKTASVRACRPAESRGAWCYNIADFDKIKFLEVAKGA